MAGPVPKKRNAPASGDSCAAGDGAPAGDQQCPARKRRQMSGMAAAQVQDAAVGEPEPAVGEPEPAVGEPEPAVGEPDAEVAANSAEQVTMDQSTSLEEGSSRPRAAGGRPAVTAAVAVAPACTVSAEQGSDALDGGAGDGQTGDFGGISVETDSNTASRQGNRFPAGASCTYAHLLFSRQQHCITHSHAIQSGVNPPALCNGGPAAYIFEGFFSMVHSCE